MKRYVCVLCVLCALLCACDDEPVLVTSVTETFVEETTSLSVTPTVTQRPVVETTETSTAMTSEETTTVSEEEIVTETSSSYSVSDPAIPTAVPTAVPTSVPTRVPTVTPTPAPTAIPEPSYARFPCLECWNNTCVDVPNYRWVEPAKTHEVTESSFSGGISHQYIEIVWYEDCDYNGHAAEAPLIQVPYEYEIDSEYQVVDDNEYYQKWTGALREAYSEAESWLDSVGAHENGINNFTYLTCAGRLELFDYEEHTYTVVDEPEHEYECGAYVCDTCGAVCFYGEAKKIR